MSVEQLREKYVEDLELIDALDIVDQFPDQESDEFVEVLATVGEMLHARGEHLAALGYYIRGRSVLENREEQLHPLMSVLLSGIGENYRLQGMLAEALPYYEKAIAVIEALGLSDNIATARLLMKSGEIRVIQGDLGEAREHLGRAYQILTESAPDNFELLGDACHNLGLLLLSEEQYDRALQALRKAADFRKKVFGAQSLERADSLFLVASAAANLGQSSGALEALYDVISIRQEHFGEDDPSVSQAKERYRELSSGIEASLPQRKEPAMQPRAPEPADLHVLTALLSTAVMAIERKQHQLAVDLLEISKRTLGNQEPGDPIIEKIAALLAEHGTRADKR